MVASLQPTLPPPIRLSHVLISYPLGVRGPLTLFRNKIYSSALSSLVHNSLSNILLVFGDQDEFTGEANYDSWVIQLQNEAEGNGKGQFKAVKIAGASHFWSGESGKQLRQTLASWLP